ncbi:MAG: phosphatidate cytidylyltransferase [Bacteroidales bacterium]|nr:phosphatidate cytidylyltransferase [Bacteroidales bacterium]
MSNTVKRSIFGILFIGVMLAGLLLDKFVFATLMIFIMIGMMMEFHKMTVGTKFLLCRILSIITAVVFFVSVFIVMAFNLPAKYVSVALLPFSVLMAASLYSHDRGVFQEFSPILASLIYIAFPWSLSNLIVLQKDGSFSGLLLLSFFIIVWASDVGAFIFGISFGQKYGKKLFPQISPKKSWIGFWGGIFTAMLASLILWLTGMFTFPLIHCLILAALMGVSGVYGDLFESMWKRSGDIKDSGSMIPGHGGLLDRFDSTLFAMPLGVLYLVLINLL